MAWIPQTSDHFHLNINITNYTFTVLQISRPINNQSVTEGVFLPGNKRPHRIQLWFLSPPPVKVRGTSCMMEDLGGSLEDGGARTGGSRIIRLENTQRPHGDMEGGSHHHYTSVCVL